MVLATYLAVGFLFRVISFMQYSTFRKETTGIQNFASRNIID